jgi:hypothetical protein
MVQGEERVVMKWENKNIEGNYCEYDVNKKQRMGNLMLGENMISCIL